MLATNEILYPGGGAGKWLDFCLDACGVMTFRPKKLVYNLLSLI
jgi:hypothetical protein